MEGEWSCYRSNHFNGGRMVHVIGQFKEGEWFCSGGLFNGGGIVMLERWSV